MALDTAAKRRAAAGVRRKPGVTPDTTKPVEWRYRVARSHPTIGTSPTTAVGLVTVRVDGYGPLIRTGSRGPYILADGRP